MDLNYLKPLLQSKLNEIGYDLYSLNYGYKEGNNVLSIYVDRVKPINMDDIVSVTDILSPYLDELIPNEESYMLEISSVGAEKPLRIDQLNDYVGQYMEFRLINPIEGENIYLGDLKENNNDDILIEYKVKNRIKQLKINKNNISKIRLAIKF